MRPIVFCFIFLICSSKFLFGQTLDYARDIFFYDKPLKEIKDFYYEHSPFLSVVQSYSGSGLKVLLIHREGSSVLLAKMSIDLEIDLVMNRPYLSGLKVITEKDEFNIPEYKPDVIILDELLLSKYSHLIGIYRNKLMLFNSNSNKAIIAKKHPEIRDWWHYNYKLEGISKELIKIWHSKENLRNQILFLERSKNFNLTIHNRMEVVFLFVLLVPVIFYGYYIRMKRRGYRIVYLFLLIPFVAIVLAISIVGFVRFKGYFDQVKHNRISQDYDFKNATTNIQSKDILDICVILRSIIERLNDKSNDSTQIKDKQQIIEAILPLIQHADERVRMLSIDLLGRLGDENYFKSICQSDWSKESSYLVRSRVVRVLSLIQNEESDKAMLALKEYEKHPYVFYELRDYCIKRELLDEVKPKSEGSNE